jgi:hypothetical protein
MKDPKGRKREVMAQHHSKEGREQGLRTLRRDGYRRDQEEERATVASTKAVRTHPRKEVRYTLNRSPHGNKTAREQFMVKTYSRILGGRKRTWEGKEWTSSQVVSDLTRKVKEGEVVLKGARLKLRREGGLDG